MVNEMGNNNVSGRQEEERSIVEEVPEKLLQEAVHADEVEAENLPKPEAEVNNFHEKVGDCRVKKQNLDEKGDIEGEEFHKVDFSTDTPLEAGDFHVEKQISDEYDQNGTELKPPSESFEVPKEASDAASSDIGLQNVSSEKDEKIQYKPSLEGNSDGTNDHQIQKEILVEVEDTETSNLTVESKSESHEVEPKSDQHEVVDDEPAAEGSSISAGDSDELVGLSTFEADNGHLVHNETRVNTDLYVVSEMDDQVINKEMDDMLEKTKVSQEDNLIERKTCVEKCEVFGPEEVEKSLRNSCDGESPVETSEPPLEAFPQTSSINSFREVSEPQEESIILTEETILVGSEMENGDYFSEGDKKFEVNESSASQSESMVIESDCKKNEKENALSSGIREGCQVEEPEMNNNEPQFGFVDQNLKPHFEKQAKIEENTFLPEETKSMGSGSESVENNFNIHQTLLCDQAVKDLKTDDSDASQSELMTIDSDFKKNEMENKLEFNSSSAIGKSCQMEEPEVKHNEIQAGFADKKLESDFVEQPEESDGVPEGVPELRTVSNVSPVIEYKLEENKKTEEIEDENKESNAIRNDGDREDIIEQLMCWSSSTKHDQDFLPQCPDSEAAGNRNELISAPEKEIPQNVQTTSVTIAEIETPPILLDGQNMAQESVERLNTESNSDNTNIQVEHRKSPSFHFDLSIGERSEESDQTRLLCHDKTAARSLSSRGAAKFQKDTVHNVYSPPEDEPVPVEEKTIRMERSDSENPSAPFLNLLKTEENGKVFVRPDEQESHAADKNAVALVSPRGNAGKRKPMSSIFVSWICCATDTP